MACKGKYQWIANLASVLLIIATLALIALPKLLRAKIYANETYAKESLQSLSEVLEDYAQDHHEYPPDMDTLNSSEAHQFFDLCAKEKNAYSYSCIFSSKGYRILAIGIPGQEDHETFMIETGGVLKAGETAAADFRAQGSRFEELRIDTMTPSLPCGDGHQVQDGGGKSYDTVLIGNQCWMTKNLDYDANHCTDVTWVNYSDEGWCGYTPGGPFADEGLLYQWSATMNDSTDEGAQGICPSGWHIPTHVEWTTLEREVCDSGPCKTYFPLDTITTIYRGTDEGDQLKTTAICYGGSNCATSGFEGLLGGGRGALGKFNTRGKYGSFWSSSKMESKAWYRQLYSGNSKIWRNYMNQLNGLSVRCLKD